MKSIGITVGALLSIVSALACSSSSGSSPGSPDGAESAVDGGSGASCSAYPLVTCSHGQTCCLGATGITGTCADPATCTSNFQFECVSAANCAGDQVCCAATELPAGFDASAYLDASLDAFAFDAAAVSGTSNKYFCQASCTGTELQLCASASECKSAGASCTAIAGTQGLLSSCTSAEAGANEAD